MSNLVDDIQTVGAIRRGRKRKQSPTPASILDHASCEVRYIPKRQLRIPIDEYQRNEAAGLIAKDIALHFNRIAFGALTVIERRENGAAPALLVADGGTRLSGALMRDDIDEVLCLVFGNLTKEQEADVFLIINQNRRKLLVEQLQHSEVFAGLPHAVRVQEILNGLQQYRIGFNALSALRSCVRRVPAETNAIEAILHAVAVDKHVGVRVFKGLVHLEVQLRKHGRSLNERSRITKLKNKFGMLDGTVNAALGAQATRSADPLICARAIALAIGIQFPRSSRK